MAGTQSAASGRRAERAAEERRARLIVIGGIAVLAVVAGIIAVGLYVTQYRAPRSHVLTVSGRDYDAAAVARRGTYYALFESGFRVSGFDGIAPRAAGLLIDEQVLRERAPATVGGLTEQELEQELAESFLLGAPEQREQFEAMLDSIVGNAGVSRAEYVDIFAAQVFTDRLGEGFREEIGDSALQLQLSRIRLTTREGAEEARALLLAGGDFAELASERSVDAESRATGGELGWFTIELLDEAAAAAVLELHAGELSAVVPSGLFFDVYLVVEREGERELDEAQIAELVGRRVNAWVAAERPAVSVSIDLSVGEQEWITERIVSRVLGELQ